METTVLIADDHPLFREALRLVVAEALGPTAITLECASLHEAREQVDLHPGIELALMDLNMPGMDGLAGLASLRARMPTLPITAAKIAISHNPAIIYKPGDGVVSSGLAYVAVRACQAVVC